MITIFQIYDTNLETASPARYPEATAPLAYAKKSSVASPAKNKTWLKALETGSAKSRGDTLLFVVAIDMNE